MPASTLRGLWIAFEAGSGQRRPPRNNVRAATNSAKTARPRVPQAASEQSALLHVEANGDGTVTYSFGDDHPETQNGHSSLSKSHLKSHNASISNPIIKPQPEDIHSHSQQQPSLEIEQAAAHLDKILHMSPVTNETTSSSTMNGSEAPKNGKDSKIAKERASLHGNTTDYTTASASSIVQQYSSLCRQSRLDDALNLIKDCIRAGRVDVFQKLKHYEFLRPAARQQSVRRALRFVQLLPRQFVDARTYNMVLTVCAEAGDVKNALRTADMLRAVGMKLDTILYTNLLKVCAAAGDADHAFEVYAEMKSIGVRVEKQVYATLVSACAEQISRTPPSDRRTQLVLLERAFGLISNMDKARIVPDAPVWNALVTAAGRAGQLQRAFSVLEEMIARSSKPNARTYAALIDACARSGDKEMALRVYKKALREGFHGDLPVYSAAINACVRAESGADLETAMAVYNDVQRNDVTPDSALFGALMMAAGRAGDLELTQELHSEMEREGLRPCIGTESALMTVYIQNNQLDRAQEIYRRMRGRQINPHLHAWNALVNAHAKAMRLGDVVSLVSDMVDAGVAPDAFTYAGIYTACHRCEECELALDVYRAQRLRGVRLDEVHTKLLLHMCLLRLRQSWNAMNASAQAAAAATGHGSEFSYSSSSSSSLYPLPFLSPRSVPVQVPAFPSQRRIQEGTKLLSALTPAGRRIQLRDPSLEVPWQAHAFHIYREAIAEGIKPTLSVLNVMLTCLRVPKSANINGALASAASPSSSSLGDAPPTLALPGIDLAQQTQRLHAGLSFSDGLSNGSAPLVQHKIGIESIYHVQAISIIEDAIVSGYLPSFQADISSPYDLRTFPPAVAEVYALTVISALQRQVESRRRLKHKVVFLVPRYDGRKVFMPSHLAVAEAAAAAAAAEGEAANKNGHPHASMPHLDSSMYEPLFTKTAASKDFANSNDTNRDNAVDDEDDEEARMMQADAVLNAAFGSSDATIGNTIVNSDGTTSIADERTGMGVAAVLRRLRLWAREHSPEGLLVLEPQEIARWSKGIQREVEKRSASALALQKPYGQSNAAARGGSLFHQSRNIRMGL